MSWMLKAPAGSGHHEVFTIGDRTQWLGLDVLRLGTGEAWDGKLADEEAALVILGGQCSITVAAKNKSEYAGLGGRADIFASPGAAVYAPRRSALKVRAESPLEVAIAKAPCTVDLPAAVISPAEVKIVSAGMANWRRDVRLVIPPGSPVSQRLIVGETINPPGNWSGIPPHKHDVVDARENILEEFYLFKARPADGYGIQVLGDDGTDRAHVVRDDDVAVLTNGYHPTSAAPGVTIGYLWVLSGDSKAYSITIDPRFNWVTSAEAVLRELKHV
jgi:5-deoxy-glucuronate isomerase